MTAAGQPEMRSPTLTRAQWNADRSVDLVDVTVGRLLIERASQHPDRTAIVGIRYETGSQERLSYRALLQEATQVADGLLTLTPRGSRVSVWAPNVIEWPILQYGAALAGIVLVALNPALRDDELHYALEHSGSAVVLYADANRDYDMAAVIGRVGRRLPDLACVSLSDTATWRSAASVDLGAMDVPDDPDEVVMLQYTSGTTGRPKGVVLRHRSLVNVAKLTVEAVAVPARAVCLNPLPMFHTAGCVIATLGPLWVGGTVVLVDRFSPAPVLAALRAENVSVLFYVPAVLSALLDTQRASTEPAPRLDIIMGGASNVSPALIQVAEDVFGAAVINLFGQTELSPVLTATRPEDSRMDQLTTIGRPLPQVDCRIVDPSTGQVADIGQIGEICARGYQSFVEYLHDPAATAAAIDTDGYVHTGDLGSMDARGYLTLTGRLKDLIIRGGENIAPTEIETHLAGQPGVADCVVVGLPDERLGEIVAAVVRTTPGDAAPQRDRLVEHLSEHLAPFKIPVRWFSTTEFPVTPTGCRVVIAMTEFAGLRHAEALRGMADAPMVVVLDTDRSAPSEALTVPGLAALGRRNAGACNAITVNPRSVGDMLYTSGTTGSPKGVLLSHDAVLRTAYASALTRAYEDGRRILFSLPCYHMFGYIEGLLSVTFVGGAIIPQTRFNPKSYYGGIERHRATEILCVPTMAVAMLEDPSRNDYDLSSLTAILCGSAPAPVWLWKAIEAELGVSEIATGYGMTECGGAMTLTRPEDDIALTSETAGRPKLAGCAGVDDTDELVVYKAVDPDNGADLPPNAEGELVSRGPTAMLGYWNRPAETAAALRDGWLHSGDLGRVSKDGFVRVTGRSKELYKSGGELVMPKEIENLLDARADISQSFAVGLHDDRWGEIGCVVVVPAPKSSITEEEVLQYCRDNLARFKVPKRVVFYRGEDLPTTPTGKVQKFRLIQQLSAALRQAGRP